MILTNLTGINGVFGDRPRPEGFGLSFQKHPKMVIARLLCLFILVAVLAACKWASNEKYNHNPFPWGVASGDPGTNDVVLWTKLAISEKMDSISVNLLMATDSSLLTPVDTFKAYAKDDFSIRALEDSLDPGTTYFYAFEVQGSRSAVGRTKTLPTRTDQVKLAIVSCSHFETGYFNAYEAIAAMDDIDAVVHLGDYIYEGAPDYPNRARKHNPEHELLSLKDYRTRYDQYHSDRDLQALHQRHPMIHIWDDHEIANNHWMTGALAHDTTKHGSWQQRRTNALKAYYEWMPRRGNPTDPIYRSFRFGKLADLHMLDTRSYRTGIAYSKKDSEGLQMLGEVQKEWLKQQFQTSQSIWNILGNQVPFAQMDYYSYYPGWKESGFDKWQGYPKDYEDVADFIQGNDGSTIVLTGDVHAAFHNLVIQDKDTIAHELITTSVTSDTWDENYAQDIERNSEFLSWAQIQLKEHNPHIQWFDIVNNGFIVLTLNFEEAIAEWYTISIKDNNIVDLTLKHKTTITMEK